MHGDTGRRRHPTMTARLVLICHGSTDAVRKFAFPADEPLDEYGRAAAAALAERLPGADRCWTSPELRTRQTAEELKLDATVHPALRECAYGAWSGQSFHDVHACDPQGVAAWSRDPTATPHGGESIQSLMRRVADWLAGEQPHHQQSIVVTHPTVIRAAIVHAIEGTPQSFWRIDVAPLSLTFLSSTNRRWTLVSTGAVGRRIAVRQ
jgi:broad specificity phosphatase PhoE